MSIDIIISMDSNIHDPLTSGQTHIVSEIFRIADDVIANKGRVVVQRDCGKDSPPHVLVTFSTHDELAAWKERLNAVQVILGREQIA